MLIIKRSSEDSSEDMNQWYLNDVNVMIHFNDMFIVSLHTDCVCHQITHSIWSHSINMESMSLSYSHLRWCLHYSLSLKKCFHLSELNGITKQMNMWHSPSSSITLSQSSHICSSFDIFHLPSCSITLQIVSVHFSRGAAQNGFISFSDSLILFSQNSFWWPIILTVVITLIFSHHSHLHISFLFFIFIQNNRKLSLI